MLSYEICCRCIKVHSACQKRDTKGRLIGKSSHFHFRDLDAISGVTSKAEEVRSSVVKSVTHAEVNWQNLAASFKFSHHVAATCVIMTTFSSRFQKDLFQRIVKFVVPF